MHSTSQFILAWFAFAAIIIAPRGMCAAEEDGTLSVSRHRALMIMLLCGGSKKESAEYSYINTPAHQTLKAICKSLSFQGGYVPAEGDRIFGIDDMNKEKVAKVFRQLQTADREADALKANDCTAKPDALLTTVAVSLSYPEYTPNGVNAVRSLAFRADDDLNARDAGHAAYTILSGLLYGWSDRKDLLEAAAGAIGNKELSYAITVARVEDWRKLPPEEKVSGRLLRTLYIWSRNKSFAETVSAGEKMLKDTRSKWFLKCLAGATYGFRNIPREVTWNFAKDHELTDINRSLWSLASSGIILPVASEENKTAPRAAVTTENNSNGDMPEKSDGEGKAPDTGKIASSGQIPLSESRPVLSEPYRPVFPEPHK
ncbi:MAG: hypothetical protein JXR97_13880 [Planctomycetes bacterium]|nr:hypothetical protein [Planctomycetota bacterium]